VSDAARAKAGRGIPRLLGRPRRGFGVRVATIATTLAASLLALAARGDDCFPTNGLGGCIDSDELWPHAGSTPYLSIGPSTTTPEGRVSFGLALSYSKRPIVLRVGSTDPAGRDLYLVDNLLDGTFLFALGITDRFELSLAAPMAFYEDGAGVGAIDGSGLRLPRSALRDGRFAFSYAFVKPRREPSRVSFGLVGRFEIAAPYGSGDAFARSQTATLAPTLTAKVTIGRFNVASEVGARLRGVSVLGGTGWGPEITASLGVSARVWDLPKLDVGAEAFAMPAPLVQPGGQVLAPGEWAVDVSAAPLLGGDLSFGLSGGGAIPFSQLALTAPLYRLSSVVRYAPVDQPSRR